MTSSDEFFQRHPVFTHEAYALSRDGGSPRTVDSLLRKHVASGRVARVRRGLYVVLAPGADAGAVDPYLVASEATPDAVISHHAALQFHGRAYSVWSQVTFLTRHHARRFRLGAIEYVPIRPPEPVVDLPDFGGGIEVLRSAGGRVRVCTCERAMVDVLHAPGLGGGWEEIWRSLDMVEFFALDAVVSYALVLKSATTAARVGLYLQQHRVRLFVDDIHLARLAQHAPKQPRYLDSAREPGRLVHPWNLIVPDRVLNQRWDEVA